MQLNLITEYFPNLLNSQQQQFSQLHELLFYWNEKINLISRKDIQHLEERHILHSLSIAKIIRFKARTKIIDIGTGGGFPGIPLAIVFPESQFLLIDSTGKKIKVVNEIINSIGMKNVVAEQMRAEEVKKQFDFAVCRAVAPVSEILLWMKGKISGKNFNTLKNGLLCLKGGDLSEELKSVKHTEYHLSNYFKEEFFLTKKIVHMPVK